MLDLSMIAEIQYPKHKQQKKKYINWTSTKLKTYTSEDTLRK